MRECKDRTKVYAKIGQLQAGLCRSNGSSAWRATCKCGGDRFATELESCNEARATILGPKPQVSKLKAGGYFVEKIVGCGGIRGWQKAQGEVARPQGLGYPGQDSWERGVNVAGARASVEEFWLALGEPMPESEVFRKNEIKDGNNWKDSD